MPMRGAHRPGWRATIRFLVRRVPFTTVVVLLMIAAAVGTGALWTPIEGLPVYPHVAFGLPAFAAGRWITLGLGAFFALIPVYYVFVAGGFALLVGFAECRLGTARTVLVTVGGHLVGVLGAAAVLAVARETGWPWALRIGAMTDVGFSAGMLAAAWVASVTLAAPWGLRIRLAAAAYAGLSLLYIGLMADLEHTLAVLAGALLARVAAGSRAVRQDSPTAGEWRLLGAVALAVVGLLQVAVRWLPSEGPTGTAEHSSVTPLAWHGMLAVLGLVAAAGWFRGRRWAWPLALGLVVADLAVALAVGVAALSGTLPDWLRVDAPTAYADGVAALALGALLIAGRAAVAAAKPAAQPVGTAGTAGAGGAAGSVGTAGAGGAAGPAWAVRAEGSGGSEVPVQGRSPGHTRPDGAGSAR